MSSYLLDTTLALGLKAGREGVTKDTDRRDRSTALGPQIEYDTRNLRSNPHRGWWNNADVLGFFGDGAWWRTNLDVRRYHPFAPKHFIVFTSLTTLQSGRVGVDIPIYRDFHIGGTNTIRGWDIDARRGKNQMINTLEYRYEVLPPRALSIKSFDFYLGLQVAAFADAGSAWNEGEFTRNFIGGGGVGLRVLFPFINVIRIDLGFGQGNKTAVSHFGVLEKAVMQRRRVR